MAAFVIYTPPGLSAAEVARAGELGPSLVASPAPLGQMLESAGFHDIVEHDLTEAFAETCEAILRVRQQMEEELRREEGDEAYDEARANKRGLLEGIRDGLLARTLIVARVSTGAT